LQFSFRPDCIPSWEKGETCKQIAVCIDRQALAFVFAM
jgi:hypothetical protein